MYSNQVYNLIKLDSGESNCVKYAQVISDLLRRISFHINTLIYSFRFYLILRLYYLSTLKDTNPIGPPQARLLP